jgi:hypothetical protein
VIPVLLHNSDTEPPPDQIYEVRDPKSGLTARRAPAQQHPGRTDIDHAVFGEATFGGAVAADVLPLELTWCVCVGASHHRYDQSSKSCAPPRREMAKVFEEMDQFRMNNMQTYARWIAARGPLRVSARQAGEMMWALTSPDVARMLCDELGWTESQHARWLADTLIRTLLPDD